MPEKSKRRKNKNKRKNKNNRVDINKCNGEVIENVSEESCSTHINNDETLPVCKKNPEPVATENQLHLNATVETPAIPEVVCSDIVGVSEDVNNNTSTRTVETLHVPVLNISNVCVEDTNTEFQENNTYIVESPEQSLKSKPKITKTVKSKSLDNDDATVIEDITDDVAIQSEEDTTVAVIETSNVLISDVESDIEWEKADELNEVDVSLKNDVVTGTLSLTTMSLGIAQCQEISTSLTPDVETSLRNYLRTLDLSTHPDSVNSVEIKAEIEQLINREIRHRLRKKALADDFGLQRLGPPRTLDVIDEEGSSESSRSSRRQSYLSDKKSDYEDLEDDVFEDKNKMQEKLSRRTETTFHHKKTFGRLVPQQCMLVGAKIKNPEVTEARGDWSMQTVEKMTGAEIVYLTDSSSSTSSLHDYGDDTDDGMETDVSVRMITPTIEVTDTEHLLKNTFISKTNGEDNMQGVKNCNEQNSQTLSDSAQNTHEIVILSTDDIKTNLYVKDLESSQLSKEETVTKNTEIKSRVTEEDTQSINDKYDLEIKVLKCELNDAINNLIKEVSDSETNDDNNKAFVRQDSSSSVCSSQCTAKYNPTSSSLNDVSNILHDDTCENNKLNTETSELACTGSHVKDVIEHVAGATTEAKNKLDVTSKEPSYLRDLCVRRIALLPFGAKILEELASVSKRIQNIAGAFTTERFEDVNLCKKQQTIEYNMPFYSLPDVSPIENVILSMKCKGPVPPPVPVPPRHSSLKKTSREDESWTGVLIKPESVPPLAPLVPVQPRHSSQKKTSREDVCHTRIHTKPESIHPQVPVQPRNSSLNKISIEEEVMTGVPTKTEPVYVCLSPSQNMLMEKTQTTITKEDASELAEMHKTYVDRRDYSRKTKDKRDTTGNEVSSIVPFKSQTGSRLLALIRDPTVTSSINSYNKNSSLNQPEQKFTIAQTTSMNHHNQYENNFNTFKPIPPPRPKKMASSFYESDENSDFTNSSMRSMKSDRKFFHFSTGNLNKEIEDDISSIQNMHRYYTNTRDSIRDCPRRPSLPKDLCDQQMEYIRQKEKEVEAEIQRHETLRSSAPSSTQKVQGPRAPLLSEKEVINESIKDSNNYFISKRRDFFASLSTPEEKEKVNTKVNHKKEKGKLSSAFSSSQEELLREKMYSEYVTQMAQREERKQHKVIKVTNTLIAPSSKISKSMPSIDIKDSKVNNRIEKEFISKARERWDKLGIKDPETEDEKDTGNNVYMEPKVIEHKIKVIEGGKEKDVNNLPSHLQDFVRFTAKEKEQRSDSSGESQSDPASPHVMIWCAVIIIVLAVGKYFLRLLRNQ